jgi:predicted MPP superfamily phosphohydrolase
MSYWTDEQIQFLQQHLTFSASDRYRFYVSRFGDRRTLDAVERQVRRIRKASQAQALIESAIREDDEPETMPAPTAQEEMLREALGRSVKVIVPEYKDREDFVAFVESLIEKSKGISVSSPSAPKSGSSMCILLSDTHIGKYTDNFNKKVFSERILSIADKLSEEMTLPSDLEEFVLMLAGDMLEGENIYETQAHHIEMVAIDQVQIAVDTFWQLAVKLRQKFNKPVRFVTVPGNHGRVSKTASEKTNWDNIIYQTLGYLASVNADKLITADINFEAFHTFQVQDKVGMLFHHGTKHLGTPAMQTKVAGWIYTKQFDFMCHGHWHHWEVGTQFGKMVMKNGSLPGDDDLSERMGVFDPPRQGWLIVRKGQPINQVGFFEWSNKEVKSNGT